jgi:hypothetical protein
MTYLLTLIYVICQWTMVFQLKESLREQTVAVDSLRRVPVSYVVGSLRQHRHTRLTRYSPNFRMRCQQLCNTYYIDT